MPFNMTRRDGQEAGRRLESTMNFRLMLLTSGLLTGTALGGCSREELAPWFPQDIQIVCKDVPTAVLGQPYTFDLNVTGGVAPLMFEATGLPMGLTIDDNGVITGTPTEEGMFNFTITVTDGDGNVRVFETCGELVVDPPDQPMIDCVDDSGSAPDGFVGITYADFKVTAPGGVVPYTWTYKNLPPGLVFTPDAANGTSATISGTPTTKGTYALEITIVDGSGVETTASCGDLVISDPISVDTDELLKVFPDGCVPLGVTLKQLQDDGIIFGGDGSPIACAFVPGRGNGNKKWDGVTDSQPPGLTLDAGSCAWGGKISSNLPFGIYAWITTFTQTSLKAYVPYCAPQDVQAPTAYEVMREDTGNLATFKPGVVILDPDEKVDYGSDVPDPKVTVTDDVNACPGNTCFYAFTFAYNTLSQAAKVNASPNSKFPAQGFDGFTHALQINDDSIASFRGRAYVANIQFDYCIADNGDDCGNNEMDSAKRAELVRKNGGGSNYYFSLVALPAN